MELQQKAGGDDSGGSGSRSVGNDVGDGTSSSERCRLMAGGAGHWVAAVSIGGKEESGAGGGGNSGG